MREHGIDKPEGIQPLDINVIKRAWSNLNEVSAKRMGRIRAIHELQKHNGVPIYDGLKEKKTKPGRVTVRSRPGGKAGKILRGQR